MTEWSTFLLGELGASSKHAFATGPFGSSISKKFFVDEGIPVIRGSNLSTEIEVTLNDEGLVFVDEEKAQKFSRSIARRGDLVFTCWGTVGQVGFISDTTRYDRYIVSNKQMKMTPDPSRVEPLFLYYLLSSPRMVHEVTSQAIGTSVPGFNLGQLKEIAVRIPRLTIQRDISRTLRSFDDLIENNRRRIEVLEEMARLLYREWFVYFRFPGHEDVGLVDSDLGPIPEGWEVRPFAELADFVNGFAFKPEHWLDEGLPIIKIKELKNGVTADTPRYHGADVSEKYFVDDGSVLFSWSADLKAYVWASGPGLLNQHLFDVRPYEVSHLFIFHSLNERMGEFRARAQGTTMKHIKRSALGEVKMALPKKKLRDEFESVARPMLDLQLNLSKQNRALREARDLLLPRLVSGELDVSELDLGLEALGA